MWFSRPIEGIFGTLRECHFIYQTYLLMRLNVNIINFKNVFYFFKIGGNNEG